MQGKILVILSAVAAIILALLLNPMKFPKEELGKVIEQIKFVKDPKASVVNDSLLAKIDSLLSVKRIVDTKVIKEIRLIKSSADSVYAAFLLQKSDSLRKDLVEFKSSSYKKLQDLNGKAEQLQSINEALVSERNEIVDALAGATDELWKIKSDSIPAKKLKHGIGTSVMFLGKNQPIYQLTYEKPLTPNLSLEGGVLWNGRPGVSIGAKVRF